MKGVYIKTKTLKYVIVKCDTGREKAIVFDEQITHFCIYNDKTKIISAGFCLLACDDRFEKGLIVETWGESRSLKLKSRELLDRNLIYQSMIIGPWDYFLNPDDPLWDEVQTMIDRTTKNI